MPDQFKETAEELPSGSGQPSGWARMPPVTADQKTPRGKCPICERTFNVRRNGTLGLHGPNNNRCLGSHRRPRKDGLDWMLNHPSVHSEVVDHFWHLENGEPCECEENGRV